MAAAVPWPLARWTFTPLGDRPEPGGYRIVPQYSAGLSLLMAGFKAIAGPCAIFWVVPICGGVLVFATCAIGRRIGRPIVGLAAAWLVATSPTQLFMLIRPNIAPLACVIVVWIAFRNLPAFASAVARKRALGFATPAAAGAIAIGVINARLYGSPLVSGYDTTDAYRLSYVLPNVKRYAGWLGHRRSGVARSDV